MKYFKQFIHFTYQQAMSCIFPVAIFLTLALTTWFEVPFMYRYDFILLVCLIVQVLMYYSGLESKDELKVIALFHVIGLALEIYKVHMGSWSYPEEALTKIAGVPLYSGFMYASVASYICQAWKRLDLKLIGWPVSLWTVPLGAAIYFNFFTHHFIYDFRWLIKVGLFLLFLKTFVYFRLREDVYRMPLVLAFILIGFFIWIAENITTFYGAWQYPNQEATWELVHIGKISSWFLLVIVSFIIVAQLKHVKYGLRKVEKEQGS